MALFRTLFAFAPERRHLAWLAIVLATLSTLLQMASYYLLYDVFDALLVRSAPERAGERALTLFLALLLHGLIYALALLCSHLFAFRIETNMRRRSIAALLGASFAFFDAHSSGRVRRIIDDNASQTHMIVAHLLPDLVVALLTPLLLIALFFVVDWRVGIVGVLLFAFGLISMRLMSGEERFMRDYNAALERMNSEAVEYVRGMPVLKIFGATLRQLHSFNEAIHSYARQAFAYALSCRIPYVIFQLVFYTAPLLVLPLATLLLGMQPSAAGGRDLLARLLFFTAASGLIFLCFMRVMYVGMYRSMAALAVETLEGIVVEMEAQRLVHGSAEQLAGTDIEFCGVDFGYGERPILSGFNLRLEGGRSYALVGPSGGGKSTLVKLLSGCYPVDSGVIRIGGRPLTDYSEACLMGSIAFIFQHARLFKASIYDNVAYGRPGASHAEVMRALSRARCDEILARFPEREQTLIGSDGVRLSGGETQRIAIARALLKDAPILLLDEASAAADPENEHEIQLAFAELMAGRTVIMIAHRLSAIRHVDEILVVADGQVVERGSHAELLARGGDYARLHACYASANEWRVKA